MIDVLKCHSIDIRLPVGYRQVVRHRVLVTTFGGSNPSTPVNNIVCVPVGKTADVRPVSTNPSTVVRCIDVPRSPSFQTKRLTSSQESVGQPGITASDVLTLPNFTRLHRKVEE